MNLASKAAPTLPPISSQPSCATGYSREVIITLLLGACVLCAQYLAFVYAPNERVMGPVQRIFYFHVGSAIACYLATGVLFVASLLYLAHRSTTADLVGEAAGEVGFVFCTIVMATGMIWGNAAWNTPFRWEPRLVTFLLLWLIFLAFILLRIFGDPRRVAQHSAVLGILGAITVPIVWYSVKLLPAFEQLHPQVIERRGVENDQMKLALYWSMGTLSLLGAYLIWIRTCVGLVERRLQDYIAEQGGYGERS